jgi:hypothetical protein
MIWLAGQVHMAAKARRQFKLLKAATDCILKGLLSDAEGKFI